jgi:hypothetical protein
MLKDSQIKSNLKKWGFTTYNNNINEALNKALVKYISNQSGGRVVMPSEYFGVNSGRYSVDADLGSSLEVTNSHIRQPLDAFDPTGGIVGGGAQKFTITQKSITDLLAEKNMKWSSSMIKKEKESFENKMTNALNNAKQFSKNSNNLSLAAYQRALKKFNL